MAVETPSLSSAAGQILRRLGASQVLCWALLPAFLTAACVSAPEPEDWMAVGYRRPEETFRTFLTGLAGDRPTLEYRCLADAFKRREGLTSELAYREFRRLLLEDSPWLRHAAEAEVLGVTREGPRRATLDARVSTWFRTVDFRVHLVREDFWELYRDGRKVADDLTDFDASVQRQESPSGTWIYARAPLPTESPDLFPSEVRVGQDWKIDGFEGFGPGASP